MSPTASGSSTLRSDRTSTAPRSRPRSATSPASHASSMRCARPASRSRSSRRSAGGTGAACWRRGGLGRVQSMSASEGTVAELIVRCLENEGVSYVFGIPGEENIHLVQALDRSPIRYVLVRHEQAAAFMAEVYGRLTGDAGVCSATLGPGAINLLLGVADATTNSTPVVALSAQVGRNRSFKESHQGVDLVSMFNPVTKW